MKLYKSKTATKNAIYRIVTPLTKGIFKDDDWRNVSRIWKTLEDNGVSISINDAKYDGCFPPTSKRWHFTAEVNGFTFTGNLIACFCGIVQDPTNRYDICFVI
jgi:hypothetical protein